MKKNLIAINEPVWIEFKLEEEREVDCSEPTDEELLNNSEHDIFLMDLFNVESADELEERLQRKFNR
ncbi:hypothetical protein [Ectobacillus funiculus]|uniref:hypothetical protein n=1 Tax=Ectobacillus funiculus TaxID=137993 RepID=UPI00101D0AAA|nr:hypothetical protein [Ectobacillus funiculus]